MASITAQLPPLASYPPPQVRKVLSDPDWEACVKAWTLNLQYRLRLADSDFISTSSTAFDFLVSFFHANTPSPIGLSGKERTLRQFCFNYARRFLCLIELDPEVIDMIPGGLFSFLASFCAAYQSASVLKVVSAEAWGLSASSIGAAADQEKTRQLKLLSSKNPAAEEVLASFRHTISVVQEFPTVGSIFMTGDDYLDALVAEYSKSMQEDNEHEQKLTIEVMFVCLRALMRTEPPQTSLLLDQLFNLKSVCVDVPITKSKVITPSRTQTILSALVCSTSFLQLLKSFFSESTGSHHARGQSILTSLLVYQQQMSNLHQPPRRRIRKPSKGKGRADGSGEEDHEMHMHAMEQVSTLLELFPDATPAYLLRLLDHYKNDVERVTAALLEPATLPPHLTDADAKPQPSTLTTAISPIPERKNAFDNDDFANLRISTSQVHYGKLPKSEGLAPGGQPASERSKHKAAILSALAVFDADEDERDDTYDVADVGGTVDSTIPGMDDAEALPAKKEQRTASHKADEILYRLWTDNSSAFARDTKSRLGQVRGQIKRDLSQATGQDWTDEMIEGWAVMLTRDADRRRTLENKYGSATGGFTGGQPRIERTSWRAGEEDEESGEGSDVPSRGSARSRGGRSRGRGQGRGGSTAGPSGDTSTQAARRRKEQRGGGNHARREGRAKKVARGFGGQAVS